MERSSAESWHEMAALDHHRHELPPGAQPWVSDQCTVTVNCPNWFLHLLALEQWLGQKEMSCEEQIQARPGVIQEVACGQFWCFPRYCVPHPIRICKAVNVTMCDWHAYGSKSVTLGVMIEVHDIVLSGSCFHDKNNDTLSRESAQMVSHTHDSGQKGSGQRTSLPEHSFVSGHLATFPSLLWVIYSWWMDSWSLGTQRSR